MTAGERLELPKNCGLESAIPVGRVTLPKADGLGTASNGLRENPGPVSDPGLEPSTGFTGWRVASLYQFTGSLFPRPNGLSGAEEPERESSSCLNSFAHAFCPAVFSARVPNEGRLPNRPASP